jgi:hypothetical protein
MIIFDYYSIAFSSYMMSGGIYNQPMDRKWSKEDLLRHMILTSLQSYRNKFKDKYGDETIVACDSNSWRKEFFEYYKAKRKKDRDAADQDWSEIFDIFNKIAQEIKQHLPWKTITVKGAEADDIIGVLCRHIKEKIIIISPDKDFVQLQRNSNVSQFSPQQKKFIKEANPENFYRELVIKGDSGDGIPNIFSKDNVLITEGIRQTPIRKEKLKELVDNFEHIQNFLTKEQAKWFDRNLKCIDLRFTPSEIEEKIIMEYQSKNSKLSSSFSKQKTKSGFLTYLIKNNCKNIIPKATDYLT